MLGQPTHHPRAGTPGEKLSFFRILGGNGRGEMDCNRTRAAIKTLNYMVCAGNGHGRGEPATMNALGSHARRTNGESGTFGCVPES